MKPKNNIDKSQVGGKQSNMSNSKSQKITLNSNFNSQQANNSVGTQPQLSTKAKAKGQVQALKKMQEKINNSSKQQNTLQQQQQNQQNQQNQLKQKEEVKQTSNQNSIVHNNSNSMSNSNQLISNFKNSLKTNPPTLKEFGRLNTMNSKQGNFTKINNANKPKASIIKEEENKERITLKSSSQPKRMSTENQTKKTNKSRSMIMNENPINQNNQARRIITEKSNENRKSNSISPDRSTSKEMKQRDMSIQKSKDKAFYGKGGKKSIISEGNIYNNQYINRIKGNIETSKVSYRLILLL